jgi:hypothetical protein
VRLVTLVLTGALALAGLTAAAAEPAAQASGLPWLKAGALPWQMGQPGPAPAPYTVLPTQSFFTLTVNLAPDGALRITDAKGVIRLRTGLPGRPLKAWRDWGTPVANLFGPLAFAERSPLQRGIGGLPVGAPDFRAALEGLLWILDDDESFLTVIHPATAQVAYLRLPGGQGLNLAFYPDRLEVQQPAAPGQPGAFATCWTLHWLALLPQFVQLGKDPSLDRPKGTALLPFPKD